MVPDHLTEASWICLVLNVDQFDHPDDIRNGDGEIKALASP